MATPQATKTLLSVFITGTGDHILGVPKGKGQTSLHVRLSLYYLHFLPRCPELQPYHWQSILQAHRHTHIYKHTKAHTQTQSTPLTCSNTLKHVYTVFPILAHSVTYSPRTDSHFHSDSHNVHPYTNDTLPLTSTQSLNGQQVRTSQKHVPIWKSCVLCPCPSRRAIFLPTPPQPMTF